MNLGNSYIFLLIFFSIEIFTYIFFWSNLYSYLNPEYYNLQERVELSETISVRITQKNVASAAEFRSKNKEQNPLCVPSLFEISNRYSLHSHLFIFVTYHSLVSVITVKVVPLLPNSRTNPEMLIFCSPCKR